MPDRFSAGGELPRIILPGGLNFIGLGQKALMPVHYLERPYYEHSSLFTHVKLTREEMVSVSTHLAHAINALSGPAAVILPMGGFSHQDRPGGPIEDPELREVCATTLEAHVTNTPITRIEAHLFAPEVTRAITATLAELATRKEPQWTT